MQYYFCDVGRYFDTYRLQRRIIRWEFPTTESSSVSPKTRAVPCLPSPAFLDCILSFVKNSIKILLYQPTDICTRNVNKKPRYTE